MLLPEAFSGLYAMESRQLGGSWIFKLSVVLLFDERDKRPYEAHAHEKVGKTSPYGA